MKTPNNFRNCDVGSADAALTPSFDANTEHMLIISSAYKSIDLLHNHITQFQNYKSQQLN